MNKKALQFLQDFFLFKIEKSDQIFLRISGLSINIL